MARAIEAVPGAFVASVEEGAMTVGIDHVLELGQRAMFATLIAAAPMLISGMVVGLIISVFQSVTQIQEITLTFVPKIVVVLITFVIFLPWMADVVLLFVRELLLSIESVGSM